MSSRNASGPNPEKKEGKKELFGEKAFIQLEFNTGIDPSESQISICANREIKLV